MNPITAKDVKDAAPGTVLAEVLAPYRGEIVRAVAVRGGAPDWAVYVGKREDDSAVIALNGDKLYPERSGFPIAATKEAIALYRY